MKIIPQAWEWNRSVATASWLANSAAAVPVVWQAWLPEDEATRSRLLPVLSPPEHARLKNFGQSGDQLRFLVGRGLLRILVGAQLGMPAEQVEFRFGPFGKPFVASAAGQPALHFNVAHAGKLVMLAFSQSCEVGVDVEEERAAADLALTARRLFPDCGYRDWLSLNPTEQLAAFYQAWTHHEARLKALGRGVSDEQDVADAAGIFCADLDLPHGYRGTVAWHDAHERASK